MNFSHLRFAIAVSSTGSFTAAAARCAVTQPTLSNGIAQLEEELGGRLFIRTTRKVSLTTFGERVLPQVLAVLAAQDNLLREAQEASRPDLGEIRIGASPLMSAPLLGAMLEPYRRTHPGAHVILRQMNVQDLERELGDGSLDFIFTIADARTGSWVAAPLYEEPLCYVPRGAAWAGGTPPPFVHFRDIADETYVMLPNVCGLARTTRALFRRHRRKLQVYPGEAMSYQVLEEWAVLGMGAAILPRSRLASTGPLAVPIVDKDGRKASISFEARWLRTGSSSHLRELAEHLRRSARGVIADNADQAETEAETEAEAEAKAWPPPDEVAAS